MLSIVPKKKAGGPVFDFVLFGNLNFVCRLFGVRRLDAALLRRGSTRPPSCWTELPRAQPRGAQPRDTIHAMWNQWREVRKENGGPPAAELPLL